MNPTKIYKGEHVDLRLEGGQLITQNKFIFIR
jgi:hypothetical protein